MLAKSVMNCILVFFMQLEKLPSKIHKEIDRAISRCVCGEFAIKKKIRLVNWDTLCKPMAMGGIGLCKASLMNRALLTTLAWRVLTQTEAIWCKVLREKCLWSSEGGAWFPDMQRASKVCRGVVGE